MKYPFEKNTIYIGDCKNVLKEFPDERVDLIYLDPPFFSNRDYEIIWEDGAEKRGYEDRWKGGINQYAKWMRKRIEPMYDILKDTGSIYLHCDWHANYKLRKLMNDIFGESNFRNEIIWHYFMGGKAKNNYARKHDTIYFYTKSDEYNFDLHYKKRRLPYKPSLKNPSNVNLKKKILAHEGFVNPPNKKTGKDELGYYSIVGMDDVWDISGVFNLSNEYMGYPTQKPTELLETIIRSSSDKKDLILDPFCGCGTTIAAAEELDRKWIGIDISPTAAKVMKKRMKKRKKIDPKIIGIPQKLELKKDWIKNLEPIDFQNYIVKCYNGRQQKNKKSDKGIDGWTENGNPIQVKKSKRIGRPTLDKFESAIRRDGKKEGIIVALSFSKGAYEESARVESEDEIDIKLVELDELVNKKVNNNELPAITFSLKEVPKGG